MSTVEDENGSVLFEELLSLSKVGFWSEQKATGKSKDAKNEENKTM